MFFIFDFLKKIVSIVGVLYVLANTGLLAEMTRRMGKAALESNQKGFMSLREFNRSLTGE